MKIKDLIKKLKQFDQNLPVIVQGYEGGFSDVEAMEIINIKPNDNLGSSIYGIHGPVYSFQIDYISGTKALLLPRSSGELEYER